MIVESSRLDIPHRMAGGPRGKRDRAGLVITVDIEHFFPRRLPQYRPISNATRWAAGCKVSDLVPAGTINDVLGGCVKRNTYRPHDSSGHQSCFHFHLHRLRSLQLEKTGSAGDPAQELPNRRHRRADRRTNDFTGDNQLHPAILLTARSGVIRRHGLSFSKTFARNGTSLHALLSQVIAHCIAAVFRKPLVVVVATDAIGMGLYFESQAEVTGYDAAYSGELLTSNWPQRKFRRVEQNIGHIHDKSAGCIPSLENRVELRQ